MSSLEGPALRRSWLIQAPDLFDPDRLEVPPDVMVFDFAELVAPSRRSAAGAERGHNVALARDLGCEVFLQMYPADLSALTTDCDLAGVAGIVLCRVETAEEVAVVDSALASVEANRGMATGSLEIVTSHDTARGNVDSRAIATASGRVRIMSTGRADVHMQLRATPGGDLHLLPHLLRRLIVVASSAGRNVIGAWWRPPARGLIADAAGTFRAALAGRALGATGTACLLPSQVAAVNAAYSATAESRSSLADGQP